MANWTAYLEFHTESEDGVKSLAGLGHSIVKSYQCYYERKIWKNRNISTYQHINGAKRRVKLKEKKHERNRPEDRHHAPRLWPTYKLPWSNSNVKLFFTPMTNDSGVSLSETWTPTIVQLNLRGPDNCRPSSGPGIPEVQVRLDHTIWGLSQKTVHFLSLLKNQNQIKLLMLKKMQCSAS